MSLSLIEAKAASQFQLAKKGGGGWWRGEIRRVEQMVEPTVYLSFCPPLVLQMVSLSMLANIQRLVVNFVSVLFYISAKMSCSGFFYNNSLGWHLEYLFMPLIKHNKKF